jgi:hypothetical protein
MKLERFSPSFISPLFAMLKRPLNPRFTQAVLDGRKFTTIRSKPWPCWKPIMLYNWSGAAYRSPQIDVAQIEVEEVLELEVTHDPDGGVVFSRAHIDGKPIHQSEGFDDAGQMQAWFSKVVKVGESASLHLMRFRLANAGSDARRAGLRNQQ